VIRVLLADDHGLVREGLRGISAKGADIEVAAEAANGDEVLALVRKHEFDLALLDLSMPGLSGIALIKRLRLEKPSCASSCSRARRSAVRSRAR
jgi:YesN/AraC family two-component response regulator